MRLLRISKQILVGAALVALVTAGPAMAITPGWYTLTVNGAGTTATTIAGPVGWTCTGPFAAGLGWAAECTAPATASTCSSTTTEVDVFGVALPYGEVAAHATCAAEDGFGNSLGFDGSMCTAVLPPTGGPGSCIDVSSGGTGGPVLRLICHADSAGMLLVSWDVECSAFFT